MRFACGFYGGLITDIHICFELAPLTIFTAPSCETRRLFAKSTFKDPKMLRNILLSTSRSTKIFAVRTEDDANDRVLIVGGCHYDCLPNHDLCAVLNKMAIRDYAPDDHMAATSIRPLWRYHIAIAQGISSTLLIPLVFVKFAAFSKFPAGHIDLLSQPVNTSQRPVVLQPTPYIQLHILLPEDPSMGVKTILPQPKSQPSRPSGMERRVSSHGTVVSSTG